MKAEFFNDLRSLSANERLLLDLIWRHGPISRKALASMGGITGASATRLTKRALDIGLIEESIDRTGDVGNPARPLRRSQRNVYAAGVGFDRRSMSFALTDIEGEVVQLEERLVESVTIDGLVNFANDALTNCKPLKHPKAKLLGVGLAIPGYRSTTAGQWAVHWDFPELQRVDVEKQIEERLGVPVVAERDAIAAAWAERLNGQGKGKSLSSFCLIYLAQGVGGAVMNDGRPVLGGNGNAGGFGVLFPYGESPRPSAYSLEEHLKMDGIPLASLDLTLNEHTKKLADWLNLITPSLRDGLDRIARLFDPDAIIFGGSMPKEVLKRILAELDYDGPDTNYTAEIAAPDLLASDLNRHSLLIGAASLPVARILGLA